MDYKKTIKKLGKETVLAMYRRMVEIRVFEEKIRYLFLEGKMPGTVHQYIGQEACAVGVCWAFGKRRCDCLDPPPPRTRHSKRNNVKGNGG